MRCRVCGSGMKSIITDLPFKVTDATIVVLKVLPVVQCDRCGEYLLEDKVMNRVDQILSGIDSSAELEVIKFAA